MSCFGYRKVTRLHRFSSFGQRQDMQKNELSLIFLRKRYGIGRGHGRDGIEIGRKQNSAETSAVMSTHSRSRPAQKHGNSRAAKHFLRGRAKQSLFQSSPAVSP